MKIYTRLCLLLLLLVISSLKCADGDVRVHIINRLGDGKRMDVHCRSKDDNLGCQTVEDNCEMAWSFSVNFWGTTLFYCDIQWEDSVWRHFNAYDASRDYRRCRSECRWMISKEGWLYGYNQEGEDWELFPFKKT
ncbi:hypothetical protein U1Q18_032516 [Sarracenia purpurea var. burkii]